MFTLEKLKTSNQIFELRGRGGKRKGDEIKVSQRQSGNNTEQKSTKQNTNGRESSWWKQTLALRDPNRAGWVSRRTDPEERGLQLPTKKRLSLSILIVTLPREGMGTLLQLIWQLKGNQSWCKKKRQRWLVIRLRSYLGNWIPDFHFQSWNPNRGFLLVPDTLVGGGGGKWKETDLPQLTPQMFGYHDQSWAGQKSSQNLLSGLPLGWRSPRTLNIFHSFLRCVSECWIRSGTCACPKGSHVDGSAIGGSHPIHNTVSGPNLVFIKMLQID